MNKTVFAVIAVSLLACTCGAQQRARRAPVAAKSAQASSDAELKVTIDQMPRTGQQSCLAAPAISGASMIGQCYTKPRRWIVVETKYTTYAKFLNRLTFNWHILLETRYATENKGNKMGIAPYSYFNTTVTYANIPNGTHAACVCLPPSYLELYGEPKAIGFTVSNENGDILAGGTVSEVRGIKQNDMFWNNQDIMNAVQADNKPMIERREGLVDRSKTIWALVNPNDYETTVQ